MKCWIGLSWKRMAGVCLLAALSTGAAVRAQPVQGDLEPSEMVAYRLEQQARAILSAQGEPSEPALAQARILLDQATALAPGQGELWSLKIEALETGEATGAQLLSALRGYLKARPEDDAAQLQMIMLLADQQQTVEERLSFFRRILDASRGSQFTPALRSRVALEAALLEREQGRLSAYAELLKIALALDETNRPAAAEAYRFLADHNAPLVDQAQALMNLFAAEPTDPATRLAVAETLLRCGLYARAGQWYGSTQQILNALGRPLNAQLIRQWALALWGAGQPQDALQLIDSVGQRMVMNQRLQNTPQPQQGSAQPQNGVTAADVAAALPADLLMVRLAVAQSQGLDLEPWFSQLAQRLRESGNGQGLTPLVAADLAWARLLFEQRLAEVPALLETARSSDEVNSERLEGWLTLRQGNLAEARAKLEPLADQDLLAALGLGLASEQGAGGELLTRVAREMPESIYGVMAAQRLAEAGVAPELTETCRRVDALVAQTPNTLRDVVQQAGDLMALRGRTNAYRLDYGQPLWVDVELRNLASVPLGLGSGRTIPTRLIILPSLAPVDSQASQPTPLTPSVVDLGRRLRLGPGETVTVRARLDHGEVAHALDANPTIGLRLGLQMVLNPQLGRDGGLRPGLLGTGLSLSSVERRAWNPTEEQIQQELQRITSESSEASMRALAKLIHLAAARERAQAGAGQSIAESIQLLYPRLERLQQAWVVSHIGTGDAYQRLFGPVLEEASRSDSELVQLVLLAGHTRQSDAPALNAALRSGEGGVRRFAELRRAWLESQSPTTQEAGPGQNTPVPGK